MQIIKADEGVRALLAERYGITDLGLLLCDTWACHGAPEHLNNRRLMQVWGSDVMIPWWCGGQAKCESVAVESALDVCIPPRMCM